MLTLKLERPLVFFDLEATGVNPRKDRIVEIALVKFLPDGSRVDLVRRINPEMPIPAEVSRIHGITDADVASCPTFETLAPEFQNFLAGCDLAGYNVLRYDIPMLEEEFLRAKIRFRVDDRRVIDAQRIYHKREPRDLAAAVQFYCHQEHVGAHGAAADTEATIRVFLGQLERYADLTPDVGELARYCDPRKPDWVDRMGRLRWVNGEVAINFGQKRGTPLRQLVEKDPGFVKWMIRSDFPTDVIDIARAALEGKYPTPPSDPIIASED